MDSQCGNDAMWRDRYACYAVRRRERVSSRGAGDRGAAARRVSWPEFRSNADPGSHAEIVSDRADDVAVVPADAYEYRHLLEVAQP
jgi:hypothetical protein